MSMEFSRRQSIKMLAGAGLLSVVPFAATSAKESKHAFIITSLENSGDVIGQFINESMDTSYIHIDHNNYESILSISHLPEGALLIGLVSDAEKVLIDAVVQDRRGHIKMTVRVNASSSDLMITRVAEMTTQAALTKSPLIRFNSAQNTELTSASLISFYAYL